MPSIQSVAELYWRALYPNPGDEVKIRKEQVIADAKNEYAYQVWLISKADKREHGEFEVPSNLLREAEIEVLGKSADISGLSIIRGLDFDMWFQGIKSDDCLCTYVKTSHNHYKALCDDDSIGSKRRVYPLGKKLMFPDGAHQKKLTLVYVSGGENIDGLIEIDEKMAGVIRRSLNDLYGKNVGIVDETNNSNPEK